ncbi:MAG: ornithine carbamoyltransferase [Bdellovibrionales bacterium]
METAFNATKKGRDFLDLHRVPGSELQAILALAHKLKSAPLAFRPMEGKTLAMIFEKPSTRTRVSFEVGIRQLGGQPINLSGAEIQLGRSETVGDTGKVLSRFVDLIMIRTFDEKKLHELAEGASIPVINGLTNQTHPCQVMADLMTAEERFQSLRGKKVVWLGDGDNNVLASWIHAAPAFGYSLRVLCPVEFTVPKDLLLWAQKNGVAVDISADPGAVDGGDIVLTDCWVSMHNSDAAARHERLSPYQVNAGTMRKAAPRAIFMHCLPAYRGEEVTDDVLDGPQSAAWDEAENRLHVQKAIMCWCMGLNG